MTVGCPASLYDVDNPDWAPTQHMGHSKVKSFQPKRTLRDERAVQRENKRRHIEAAKTLIQLNEELASQAGKNALSRGKFIHLKGLNTDYKNVPEIMRSAFFYRELFI